MRLSQGVSEETEARNGRTFGDVIGRDLQSKGAGGGGDFAPMPSVGLSTGGLLAPDGQTSDPFPPSLAAYLEVIRSITDYLRGQGMISGGQRSFGDAAIAPTEEPDVAEPTTFAIGEEEHAACAVPGATPAIGEAVAR